MNIKFKSVVSRIIRIVIPIIILYLVFKRIDFAALKLNISNANPLLFVLGVCFQPLIIMIGGIRWYVLLLQYKIGKVRIDFVLLHYWIGLTLGYFTPAFLGWEAYRIAASGHRYGQYTINTTIIFVEKIIALICCTLIIILLYPIAPITFVRDNMKYVIHWIYILFFVSIISLVIINIAFRNRVLYLLLEKLEVYFFNLWKKMSGKLGLKEKIKNATIPIREIIKPLTVPKQIFSILILSLSIQLMTALKDQIFFRALGYPIPFIANLLVSPLMFFAFILPISFGSIGIREGAHIIFYGMFGVPAEIALLVSFFNLFGLLLNILIGGLIMIFSNFKRKSAIEINS